MFVQFPVSKVNLNVLGRMLERTLIPPHNRGLMKVCALLIFGCDQLLEL